jgi:Cdc6-like AAA superfamily ATPase
MSMFTVAQKEVGFVKASLYGPPGTGKTTLLAMLLLYLSKTYHNSAPVAWIASGERRRLRDRLLQAGGRAAAGQPLRLLRRPSRNLQNPNLRSTIRIVATVVAAVGR